MAASQAPYWREIDTKPPDCYFCTAVLRTKPSSRGQHNHLCIGNEMKNLVKDLNEYRGSMFSCLKTRDDDNNSLGTRPPRYSGGSSARSPICHPAGYKIQVLINTQCTAFLYWLAVLKPVPPTFRYSSDGIKLDPFSIAPLGSAKALLVTQSRPPTLHLALGSPSCTQHAPSLCSSGEQ